MSDRKLLFDALHDAARAWNEPDWEELFKDKRSECEAMQTLLLKIGWVLEQPCWRTYGALATLLNDINDLLTE